MKNDLKYIIKKIIIGIGIALGIIFFKPYIALAETTSYGLSLYSNNNFSQTSSFMKYKIFTLNLDSKFTGDPEQVSMTFYYRQSSQDKGSYVVFRDEINNRYFISLLTTRDTYNYTITDYNGYGSQCDNCVELYSGSSGVTNQSSVTTPTYTTNNGYIFYAKWGFSSYTTNNLGLTTDNYKIIDTNIENLTINNIPWEEYYSPIPSGYEQINLSGYQGVLVIPKNFNTMLNDSSHTEEIIPGTIHTFLDLDYYSQNCVRGVLINIQNVQNILTSDISSGSGLGASAGAINGTCFEEPTKTTLSYQYDIYSGFIPQGILIYNNQKIEPNWDSGFNSDFNPFGESFVWVNTNLYNYYLIPNLSTFNADINYVDYDNTDKNLKIENLPTFEDLIKDTQLNQDSVNDNLNTRAKLESIFSFVKIPFTFLNNLINGTCEPLTARFPHSSTDIVLPCLSVSFAGWLGEQAYKGFQLIINGLLVYKIAMSLIQFTTKNLDPSDARIEVLDL